MIEDLEMGALFRDESEEHLKNLEDGLLRLETDPTNSGLLKELYRAAHSLKGAARMLNIGSIEAIGHSFEDLLGTAAGGRSQISSETIERLYDALDGVRVLVREAVTGEPANLDVNALLAGLTSEEPTFSTSSVPEPLTAVEIIEPTPVPAPPEQLAIIEPEPLKPEPTKALVTTEVTQTETSISSESIVKAGMSTLPAVSSWKIETIRVEPAKLDGLLAMAGELVVTTTRANRGLAEIEAATALWEEWNRSAASVRRTLNEFLNSHGGHNSRGTYELRMAAEREAERIEQFGEFLERLRTAFQDVGRLQNISNEVEDAIHSVRLLPLSTVFQLFTRPVRDLAKSQYKEIHLVVEGGETFADKRVLEEIKDPLMHLLRNAVDHGIEPPHERERVGKPREATLWLRGYNTATTIVVELQDNGRGLNLQAIRNSALRKGLIDEATLASLSEREVQELIFTPGFSTASNVTDVSGRGVGLDVVRANVENLRGSVEVESWPGQGCRFRLTMPVTLATSRVLLVRLGEYLYALPVEAVHGVQQIYPRDVFQFRGREAIAHNEKPLPLERLASLLQLGASARDEKNSDEAGWPSIIVADGGDRIALIVDELIDEQEIVLKPLDPVLRRARTVSGATILDDGQVCLVLNPYYLVKGALARRHGVSELSDTVRAGHALAPAAPKVVLLAEDSITTRTQEKRILEGAGYQVVTAVDGLDAWHKLVAGNFDAVVSDVEMPNLDGFSLAERIRLNEKYKELPIILVTSLASDDDRRRGVQVGANAYITKSAFDQRELIDALKRFI